MFILFIRLEVISYKLVLRKILISPQHFINTHFGIYKNSYTPASIHAPALTYIHTPQESHLPMAQDPQQHSTSQKKSSKLPPYKR